MICGCETQKSIHEAHSNRNRNRPRRALASAELKKQSRSQLDSTQPACQPRSSTQPTHRTQQLCASLQSIFAHFSHSNRAESLILRVASAVKLKLSSSQPRFNRPRLFRRASTAPQPHTRNNSNHVTATQDRPEITALETRTRAKRLETHRECQEAVAHQRVSPQAAITTSSKRQTRLCTL